MLMLMQINVSCSLLIQILNLMKDWTQEIQLIIFYPASKVFLHQKRMHFNYDEKVKASLVCEFNRIQHEEGKDTISHYSATTWLKEECPKLAIYPHQADYCDFCAIVKKINSRSSTEDQSSKAEW